LTYTVIKKTHLLKAKRYKNYIKKHIKTTQKRHL